ncbi:MAG TPA: NTP transferase domain-containing protein, partial [Candidatus Eisenbacteria bacterium]|nr:NTP transferase domain-containing protein [Candidatus Eisenbacteria bacterium]
MNPPAAIILAAGRGTRMKSDLPKALHEVCGVPMVGHLVETARSLGVKKTVVIAGFGIAEVRRALGRSAEVVDQGELLGSGHAVSRAAGKLKNFKGPVVVFYCDTPLIGAPAVKALLEDHRRNRTDCSLLSVERDDPTGYGRIVRGRDGGVARIVEENDASDAEKAIREVNVGCYVFRAERLFDALKRVPRNPVKKEYYLTDAVGILSAEGRVGSVVTRDRGEVMGVNTPRELAEAEGILQQSILDRWSDKGVRIRDPRTTVIDADVTIGAGTLIHASTVIEEGARIGKGCVIGPFARIRGGSVIGDGAVVGNFVEIVRSSIGKRSQVKHLSYLGDAEVGESVNVGAGTITANFDGKKKHRTVIRDG